MISHTCQSTPSQEIYRGESLFSKMVANKRAFPGTYKEAEWIRYFGLMRGQETKTAKMSRPFVWVLRAIFCKSYLRPL